MWFGMKGYNLEQKLCFNKINHIRNQKKNGEENAHQCEQPSIDQAKHGETGSKAITIKKNCTYTGSRKEPNRKKQECAVGT